MKITTTLLTLFTALAIASPGLQAEIVAHFPLDEDAIDTIAGFEGDDPERYYQKSCS